MDLLTNCILKIGIALSKVRELDKLLDIILQEARALTKADAGSIYLVEDNVLRFITSQNQTLFKRLGEKQARELFKKFTLPLNEESIAGYVAVNKKILNIPDVYNIPPNYRFKFNSKWDKANNYKTKSMLTIPLIYNQNEVVGVLQLINARSKDGKIVPFELKDNDLLPAFASQAAVAIVNTKFNNQLHKAQLDVIFRLSIAAEYKSKETANHIKRVSEYSALIGQNIGLSKTECFELYWAAALHDVGKIGIPEYILHKPGKLTSQERKIMEKHTILGAFILRHSQSRLLECAREIALTHHEKFNGAGYPRRLKGKEIPLFGRIVAVADVFDALSSNRVYKPAFPLKKVFVIMNQEKGLHFDPQLLDALFSSKEQIKMIQETFADEENNLHCHISLDNISIEDLNRELLIDSLMVPSILDSF